MHRRLPAALLVVVHHVVVDQRHRVQELQGRGRVPDRGPVRPAGGAIPPHAERGPDPLAARTHQSLDLIDRLGGARLDRGGLGAALLEEAEEDLVDARCDAVERGHGGGGGRSHDAQYPKPEAAPGRPPIMVRRSPMKRTFRALATATVVVILLLIAWGGVVRATGSGDGCPDWPQCFGSWIPRARVPHPDRVHAPAARVPRRQPDPGAGDRRRLVAAATPRHRPPGRDHGRDPVAVVPRAGGDRRLDHRHPRGPRRRDDPLRRRVPRARIGGGHRGAHTVARRNGSAPRIAG